MASQHRFGFLTITGPPNAGKSTLLNTLIGEKISIISRRPQTTRHRILGIKTLPNTQMVFIDTPGIYTEERQNLNRVINKTAVNSLYDVDLILFMIDYRGWWQPAENAFRYIKNTSTPTILLINKIDRLKEKHRLLPLIAESINVFDFKEIIPISARFMKDKNHFLELLIGYLPEGSPCFPTDHITNRSECFLAVELIREQTFRLLGQELPYSTAVELIKYQYNNKGLLCIEVIIWVEKNGQKSIVIGKGGKFIKSIAKQARLQIEKSCGDKVYLNLWVKVRKRWAENNAMLHSLGYLE